MEKRQISAKIIADSKNEFGDRLTSFVVTMPRIVLAELNTHRVFSRNSASSRAIPFKKMVKMVEEDPFIPIAFQKDHSGMQGTEYFSEGENVDIDGMLWTHEQLWLAARDKAVKSAKKLAESGATKQLVNRLLEPFMWHTVIITATEFENFFKLRCPQYQIQSEKDFNNGAQGYWRSRKDASKYHKMVMDKGGDDFVKELPNDDISWLKINQSGAEIHIARLAELMWDAYNESEPKQLEEGEWHIPFGDNIEVFKLLKIIEKEQPNYDPNTVSEYSQFPINWLPRKEELMVQIATARCARVSYMNYEGKDDYEADIKLFNQLKNAGHASPFEHCACVGPFSIYYGNFKGFTQLRKVMETDDIGSVN